MIDEEFEEWKAWFDSHKEPDGSIHLAKHPHLVDHISDILGIGPKPNWSDLEDLNVGSTLDFKLIDVKHG